MTVQSQTSRESYAGAGTTGPFAVPFYFLDAAHLQVIVRSAGGAETTLTLNTDYTVTGAGSATGGEVNTTVAVAVGESITILRSIPITQLVDYVRNDPFPETTHEMALDKLTQICQQLKERLDRALTIPATDDSSDLDDLIEGVLTLLGIVDDITTVAGISTEVQAVAANEADISTVAGSIASVNTVAARDADIGTVADRDADIGIVADRDADIGTLAAISGALVILAMLETQIATLAALDTEITALGARTAEIDALYADLANITAKLNTDGSNAMTGALMLPEIETPALAAAGVGKIYSKDKKPHWFNEDGDEFDLTEGTGGNAGDFDYDNSTSGLLATNVQAAIDEISARDELYEGTPVATTSGTAVDFTSIPSGVKRITISFSGVSINASARLKVQIGDSGGVETTGYTSTAGEMGSVSSYNNFTDGFSVFTMNAAILHHGQIVLTRLSAASNLWAASGTLVMAGASYLTVLGGSKALSAELDRVRITADGSATFDAGEVNVLYEK